jgi:hypothetical protein
MQLLTSNEFLKQNNGSLQNLPFCFLEENLVNKSNVFILNYNHFFSVVRLENIRGFKTVQFVFPPFNLSGERLPSNLEAEFCNEAICFFKKTKLCHRVVQPTNYCLFNSFPQSSTFISFGTYKVNLSNTSPKQILANMQPRYRTAINQVAKLNYEIKFGIDELKNFVKLHQQTMQRTESYFESETTIKNILSNAPNSSLLANIYINNEIQGGVFIQYSNYSAYYMHGASAKTTIAIGAIKFLHYQIMCRFAEMNIRCYDFVGARLSDTLSPKLQSIQDFKKRFGSKLETGYLWKIDLNKSICLLYDTLLKIKCKLKNKAFPIDIIDQELSIKK